MPLVCKLLLDANVTWFPAPADNLGCFGRAHFQTADADRVFPWQRRERVVEFNREARVAAEAAGGRFVDLAPATEGARATSDGVHYLTAVNLVKARIFIALLHMSHDI